MPELPEVEVVRAGLEPAVTGAGVASVTVFDERSLRRHDGPSEDFIDRLVGRRMLAPQRRGKFMWVPLAPVIGPHSVIEPFPVIEQHPVIERVEIPPTASTSSTTEVSTSSTTEVSTSSTTGEALVVHLGMSGQVLLRDQLTDDALTRIRIDLDNGLRLNFVDQRIFGSMSLDTLAPTVDQLEQLVPNQVAHIARDPLDEHFDERLFLTRLAAKNTTIKRALLDQALISGIGNIYADESLWGARVHYDQPTATLSRARAKALLAEVRLVLGRALAEGGTSFDAQYINVNGQSGYFAHSLQAYGQQGRPCPRCGRPIVREQFMNRGSHFCAHCQRIR